MKSILPLLVITSSVGQAFGTAIAERDCVGTPYTDALTRSKECCDQSSNVLYIIDELLDLGVCCAFGNILQGLSCVLAPPPPTNEGICSGEAVCPTKSGKDLGISYGDCYVLESVSNMYLGHNAGTTYVVQGENPGVVFRVCGDLTTCTTNVGTVVGLNNTWYMQDQFGDINGDGFGWLGGAGELSVQDNSTGALVVGGSSICYGGKCAVCLAFPPGGAGAPCPLPDGVFHLGVSPNPNHCQPFFFQQVSCRSEKLRSG